MTTPYISINISKIEHNARIISDLGRKHGVMIAGVTKGVLAMREVTEAMLRGGIAWVGDSRLDNIERHRANDVPVPLLLMRPPAFNEADRAVKLADISLVSEYETLRLLSEAALRQGKAHKVIVMVDMGDLREGVWPDELMPLLREVLNMKGIEIIGLGTNFSDLSGVIPTVENNQAFVDLAEEAEAKLGLSFRYLSAGNSSSIHLMSSGKLPARINHMRIGEGILLGTETIASEAIPGAFLDAFELNAEVIELKRKPSLPVGEIGQDAFGNIPQYVDKGTQTRIILNIGQQDVKADKIVPKLPGLEIIGICSDHLILDATNVDGIKMGSVIPFDVKYAALLAAMTSPFVGKVLI